MLWVVLLGVVVAVGGYVMYSRFKRNEPPPYDLVTVAFMLLNLRRKLSKPLAGEDIHRVFLEAEEVLFKTLQALNIPGETLIKKTSTPEIAILLSENEITALKRLADVIYKIKQELTEVTYEHEELLKEVSSTIYSKIINSAEFKDAVAENP